MRSSGSWKNVGKITLIGVLSAVIAFGVAQMILWAAREFGKPNRIETEMARFRATPLVGALLRDNPSASAALKEALTQDIDGKTTDKSRAKVAELRKTLVGPAIMAAQDEKVIAIWKAQHALMTHLETANAKLCREFFETGIRDVNALDRSGKDLFNAVLQQLEAGYLDGKGRPGVAPVLDTQYWAKLFGAVGFTKPELDLLANTKNGSDREVCDVGLKLHDGVMTKLSIEEQPRAMRAILSLA
ncbi:hypothetical protein [Bosea sp. (in: a-proteobacteria)]|jgi:phosphate/sulfate permease|uniref:hypothetical protein n=1 Tax=Bosea sp. (in: a-proteobacteria) TaxID=1871050 RepID=UPI003F729F2C